MRKIETSPPQEGEDAEDLDAGRSDAECSSPAAPPLRRGWTTGACATAAAKSAVSALIGQGFLDPVTIPLPGGQAPAFTLTTQASGAGWARAGVTKDAGDDPDVTHGALVEVTARFAPPAALPKGLHFKAGAGVGTVTKEGLPIAVGEPSITPRPREMMRAAVGDLVDLTLEGIELTIAIPGGEEIAKNTWNGRLGIVGGLSILGTTGVVVPYSCAAWIHSIHRGIDVARAAGLTHVAGATGHMSETGVQALHGLPLAALIDMGDFAGALMKYLAAHPVPRFTLAGGVGKVSKLAQGHGDLHSARSEVDVAFLARLSGQNLDGAQTAAQALQSAKDPVALVQAIARAAQAECQRRLKGQIAVDVQIFDRKGQHLGGAA